MKDSNENKEEIYPIVYDYWNDIKTDNVYIVIEYDDKKIDDKHSNLYLIQTKFRKN